LIAYTATPNLIMDMIEVLLTWH